MYKYCFYGCFSVASLGNFACSIIESSLIVTATIVAELIDPDSDRRKKSRLSFPMLISTCLDIGRWRLSKWWDRGILTRPNGFSCATPRETRSKIRVKTIPFESWILVKWNLRINRLTMACTSASMTMYWDQLLLTYVAARVTSRAEYTAPDSTTIFRARDVRLCAVSPVTGPASRLVNQIRSEIMTVWPSDTLLRTKSQVNSPVQVRLMTNVTRKYEIVQGVRSKTDAVQEAFEYFIPHKTEMPSG